MEFHYYIPYVVSGKLFGLSEYRVVLCFYITKFSVSLFFIAAILILPMYIRYNSVGILKFLILLITGISIHHPIKAQNNPADLDSTFNHGSLGHSPSSGVIKSIVTQPDGKILVGGVFSTYLGKPTIPCFTRLNPDGTLDKEFNKGNLGVNGIIASIALQSDGKIVIGGQFVSYNGIARKNIARLNKDGSIDFTFNPGTGFDDKVNTVIVQPDGKILAGGHFISLNGVIKRNFVRINTDGSTDMSFIPVTGPDGYVTSLSLQSDGKIIVGGGFSKYSGVSTSRLVRVNTNGTMDVSFNVGTGPTYFVDCSVQQSDGKIMIGGEFSSYNGVARSFIARLQSNGAIDLSFNAGTFTPAFAPVYAMAVQPNGKYIIAGQFLTIGGIARSCIARLNADGTLDSSFDPGTGVWANIYTMSLQSNGKIILGGAFSNYNSQPYNNLVRLRGDNYFNTISGNVYFDHNNDCLQQSIEKRISSVLIKAMPGNYFGITNDAGKYQISVDSGTASYTISHEFNGINEKLLINQCLPTETANLFGSSNDVCCFNFADSVKNCSILNISVQSGRMRRCFRKNTYVNYNNFGNSEAENSYIRIEYPEYIIPISSFPMWTSKKGSILVYDLGTVAAGGFGGISIVDSVVCGIEEIRGLTQCIKATIFPASDCLSNHPSWDKSSIKVSGRCANDSIHFAITNSGSGNMLFSQAYRIYMNDTLIYTGTFILQEGESIIVKCLAEQNTFRLEADQHPLHPGNSRPRYTVEGCGISGSTPVLKGLVNTVAQDDLNEEIAFSCNVIFDSFDPNDKIVFPSGTGIARRVAPGQELEYVIRFQNTGTDTAYNVRIVDTLDSALDPASFIKGASSHPYRLDISGKGQAVLTFNFKNINLPDSATNFIGSNGLVSYRITIPNSTTLGTTIRNKAHIFFDYNSAVITNETINTIGLTAEETLVEGYRISSEVLLPKPIVVATNPISVCFPESIDLTRALDNTISTSNLNYLYFKNIKSSEFVSDPSTINTSGTYSIVGLNEGGGTDTALVVVKINAKPSLFVTSPAPVCLPYTIDLTDLSVTSGSSEGLSYTYFTDAALNNSLNSPSTVGTSGSYYIIGVDNNGCADTSYATIEVNSKPNLVTPSDLESCNNIDITVSSVTAGSSSGLSYSYYSDAQAEIAVAYPNSLAVSGLYYIVGTKVGIGCSDTSYVNVIVNAKPIISITAPLPVCAPNVIDLTDETIVAGSSNGLIYSYYTNSIATIPIGNPSSISVSGNSYLVGITSNGCSDTAAVIVVIKNKPSVVTNSPIAACYNETIDLTDLNITSGSTIGLNYAYYTDAAATMFLNSANRIDFSATFYIVGTTSEGCSDTASIETQIITKPYVLITPPEPSEQIDLTAPSIVSGSTPGLIYSYFSDEAATLPVSNPIAVTFSGIYYIVGTNLNGCSDTSAVDIITGITKETISSTVFNLYPNPAHEFVTIETSEGSNNLELRIYSGIGFLTKVIKLANSISQQINLEGMYQGLYMYEIRNNNGPVKSGKLQIR